MTTMLDEATRTDRKYGSLDIHYRVRQLSLRGEVSESVFSNETDARAHQQAMIASSGEGLVVVERLVRIDGNGGPARYEVTAIARDLC